MVDDAAFALVNEDAPEYIFIVERHDFMRNYYRHHPDKIGRKHFHSAHTTLEYANKKARELLYQIEQGDVHRDAKIESQSDIADEPRKLYKGDVYLWEDDEEDNILHSVVRVRRIRLRQPPDWDDTSNEDSEYEELEDDEDDEDDEVDDSLSNGERDAQNAEEGDNDDDDNWEDEDNDKDKVVKPPTRRARRRRKEPGHMPPL
ncbi:MAG: hypothetical protein M1820_007077 [Bogoriella megaspora]|nr:MAG: hypothetical protein M1820_007077 [Bogoriella megaspora]